MDSIFQSRQYEVYEKSNRKLERTIKGINDYLERKRLQFPRFFFFSNEDLIFFLSREKEPISLGPFLHKCFEGVTQLIVEEKNGLKDIKGIISNVGESLEFVNPIQLEQIFDEIPTNRSLEEWLKDVEKEITVTLQYQFEWSMQKEDVKCVQQIIQLVNQIKWTECIEDSIKEKSLPKAFDIFNEKIKTLVAKVQDPSVSEKEKIECTNMILVDIHNKEVIESLQALEVANLNTYEWQSELRYYTHMNSQSLISPQCQIFTFKRDYGFDYLSDWLRLVMTPMTTRCYRALLSAIHTFRGGSIEGAMGVGKTETTKDLGKAVGKICFSFGGSSALQVDSFARLFKGAASSGMWICINEFNMIQVEVLSVVAQLVQELLEALKAHAETIDLQGSTTILKQQCGIFVTLNPGYGYESTHEVPENLRGLFRVIIITMPSREIIARTYLEAYGYKEAKELGHVLASVLDLATSQLEPKKHYDFSLRSLKIVLRLAAKEDKTNERASIYNSLKKFYKPRLDASDAIVFEHILNDNIKTQSDVKSEENIPLYHFVELALKIYNFQSNPLLLEKILQLDEVLIARPAVIILGDHFTGKSSAIDILSTARSLLTLSKENPEAITKLEEQLENTESVDHLIIKDLYDKHILDTHKLIGEGLTRGMIKIHKIAPKALSLEELYGEFNKKEVTWHEGVLPHCIRVAISQAENKATWIIFDGSLEKAWCDGLYSTLDDTRKLCLPNSENLLLPDNLAFIFESDSLCKAAPSTITRCGILSASQKDLPWESIYKAWISTLPSVFRTDLHTELIDALKKELFEPALAHLFDRATTKKLLCNFSAAWVCKCFVRTFEAFLFGSKTKEELEEEYKEKKQRRARRKDYMKLEGREELELTPGNKKRRGGLTVKKIMEFASIYLMGIVWTINPLVEEENRVGLFQMLRNRFVKLKQSNEPALEELRERELLYPPDNVLLNEIRFDKESHSWISFKDQMWSISEEDGKKENIIIPNEDLCKNYWFIKTLIKHHTNTVILGNTGSAKSLMLRKVINIEAEKWIKRISRFTGRTAAITVQEVVEDNYTKRFKSTYAPKGSANIFLFCIDDLHLPNTVNRQNRNPLELLRELLSHGGIYDKRDNTFKKIIKLQLAATIGLKKGRLNIDQRMLSSFCLGRLEDLSDVVIKSIYGRILECDFQKYDDTLKECKGDLLDLTLKVYKNIREKFLPVPSKSHYNFSLKNLTDVFRGLSAVPPSIYEGIEDDSKKQRILYSLWLHECMGSIEDVLLDLEDKKQFEILLKNIAEESVQVEDWTQVYKNIPSILFSNIITGEYQEVNIKQCADKVKDSLEEYTKVKKNDLNLVLCETVIRQILKIARVLSICKKHGLLIGAGGNNRTKLTQITCFILGFNFFALRAEKQPSKIEWRENIKELFRVLSKEKRDTVFLCSEQIFRNGDDLINDLDSLLSNGTVPELFNVKEKDELMVGKKDKSYDNYLLHAKEHLRIVLCMNPISDILRKLYIYLQSH